MKLAKYILPLTLSSCLAIFIVSETTKAEEKKGWLRDKIKSRVIKKLQDQPAPQINYDSLKKIETPGSYTITLSHAGLDRYYTVHVPKSYNSTLATPLLVALHGGGGDMSIQSNDDYYKLISKSESAGFIVIFPNGTSQFKSGKLATWNAGKCCGEARESKADDVGFIKKILELTKNQLNIDSKKIFATGMSNGAMMTYRLACELSTTFKAIAAVAGTDNTLDCKPETTVSILHIHAKNDDHVLFNGGAGKPFANDVTKVNDFVSVPDTITKWVKLNNCESNATRFLDKPGVYCDRHTKCKNNAEVELCVTEKGGHSWPGGKKPRGHGEAPSAAISANDIMWDFFNKRGLNHAK